MDKRWFMTEDQLVLVVIRIDFKDIDAARIYSINYYYYKASVQFSSMKIPIV